LWSGGPNATKSRTFTIRCKLPRFETRWLTEVDGKEGIYRNPVVLGRELKNEMDSGKWRSQAEFAATLGISPTRLRSFIHLTRLDPDVEALFVALGSVLSKCCVIGTERIQKLLKPPKEKQILRAKELIREMGIGIEECLS
jgi:hypothetical protein